MLFNDLSKFSKTLAGRKPLLSELEEGLVRKYGAAIRRALARQLRECPNDKMTIAEREALVIPAAHQLVLLLREKPPKTLDEVDQVLEDIGRRIGGEASAKREARHRASYEVQSQDLIRVLAFYLQGVRELAGREVTAIERETIVRRAFAPQNEDALVTGKDTPSGLAGRLLRDVVGISEDQLHQWARANAALLTADDSP